MRQQDFPVLDTYAEALVRAADENGQLDAVFQEAGHLRHTLAIRPKLMRLMERPAIEKDEKKALLRRVLEGRVTPVMLYLPLILIDNNRGGLWDDILGLFIARVERRNGILPAQIVTARPLSDAEKNDLRSGLEKHMGKQLHITYRQNPGLTGGVLFRCDDLLIDSTVSRALDKLRDRLQAVRVG